MRRVRIMAALCCLLATGPWFGGKAAAQALATLQGTIVDESQGPLPGVSVKITNTQTGYTRTVFTDENGGYKAPSLQPGVYMVEGSLQGLQATKQENIRLQVGQILDVDLKMGVETMAEAITVTAEAPVIEVSRSSSAKYVTEEEISAIPISGRDFVDFALLTPTVKAEPDRGGISLSGQRGVSSGLKLDGAEGKSAFFGYGRGGEVTENDGLVVAQDSVKEFQVITNGFAPEFGQNGGGYVNVVTKSGTNDFRGTGFFLFRNQSFVSDLPLSPFNENRDNECMSDGGTINCTPNDFDRLNWGASFGGPLIKDKTHFFVSYDQLHRTNPFINTIDIPGVYSAVLSRYPQLVPGYTLNDDGTASGQFTSEIDNLILFGKVDHQLSASNTLTLRYNYTDFERVSDYIADQDMRKPDRTNAIVGQLVSLFGNSAVNEFRIQYASDDFERRHVLEGDPIEAQLTFVAGGRTNFIGKANFLPIFTGENKWQVQDNFSYLFGDHDLKFGFDYQRDNISQLFAGFADGDYQYSGTDAAGAVARFLANRPTQVQVFYGNVSNPNFDVVQTALGVYAQDSWKPNSRLTLNFGLRWDGTFNPDPPDHLLDGTVETTNGDTPEADTIPDDLNNFAPRVGFAYSMDEEAKSVLRGGVGLFYSRTPTLLWATAFTSNGIFPNVGVVRLDPNSPTTPVLGEPIDNGAAPPGTRFSVSLADPDFEDPSTWRFNLGYEREVVTNWTLGADLVYAHADNLHSNDELNRVVVSRDEFGRPTYNAVRPNSNFQQLFVRASPGWSNYFAGTLSISKRFADHYQLQAHYTYSKDKDTDSNERTATAITITDIENIDFDYGVSTRDVPHRLVFSGLAELPLDFKLSGAFFLQSGTAYTALEQSTTFSRDPNGTGAPRARAVVDGELVDRGGESNDSFTKLDLRLSKFFDINKVRIEAFGEVFNALNTVTFNVAAGQANPFRSVVGGGVEANPDFGQGNTQVGDQRQFQLGARLSF